MGGLWGGGADGARDRAGERRRVGEGRPLDEEQGQHPPGDPHPPPEMRAVRGEAGGAGGVAAGLRGLSMHLHYLTAITGRIAETLQNRRQANGPCFSVSVLFDEIYEQHVSFGGVDGNSAIDLLHL